MGRLFKKVRGYNFSAFYVPLVVVDTSLIGIHSVSSKTCYRSRYASEEEIENLLFRLYCTDSLEIAALGWQ
jgi:hypothetical protein